MKYVLLMVLVLLCYTGNAQYDYEPTIDHPFGQVNINAPSQLLDYSPLIGISDCVSQTRKKDKSWNKEEPMIWTFKYIQNGTAIQDESLKPNNKYSGSIRQYSVDSARWYVHYYSNPPSSSLRTWEGNLKEDNMILYNEQKAPNGTEGFYKITFSEISNSEFKWLGEWVNKNESFKLPTWKIACKKRVE